MLDRTMDRMEYVEGRQKVKDQYAKWDMVTVVLVEDSSSGQAILSDLRTTGIPLLPISPAGSDKEANARAVSPMFEAGMILLPEGAQWIDDYVESMTRFPKGRHDDDVDSTSQALNYLRRRQHGVMEYIERELAKRMKRISAHGNVRGKDGGDTALHNRINETRADSEVGARDATDGIDDARPSHRNRLAA